MHKKSSNVAQSIGIFVIGLLLSVSVSAEPLTIRITKGLESALPIAIVPFQAPVGEDVLPEGVANIIAANLEGSGRFKPMPVEDMPSSPHEFQDINFRDWRLLGMENLVIGTAKATPEGYELEFRLIDVYKGTQLTGYKIPARSSDLRLAAHRISDIIYEKITGERGAFSTRIAYVTVQTLADGSKKHQLQVADADGHNAKTLLESPQSLMSPAWSPDGTQLAYVSFEGRSSAIYIQNLRTGKREKIAAFPGINSAPAWSPDGRYLAMTLSKDGNPEIYIMHMLGRRLQRMTTSPGIDTEPSWSPDGETLVYTSDRGGRPQIYKVDALGGRSKRVSFQGGYNARAQFSADGKSLIMVHGNESGYHIARLNLENGNVQVLTDGHLDESPSIAPNGSMVIYATTTGRGSELAAVSADGRVKKRLASQQGEVRAPSWGPIRLF